MDIIMGDKRIGSWSFSCIMQSDWLRSYFSLGMLNMSMTPHNNNFVWIYITEEIRNGRFAFK